MANQEIRIRLESEVIQFLKKEESKLEKTRTKESKEKSTKEKNGSPQKRHRNENLPEIQNYLAMPAVATYFHLYKMITGQESHENFRAVRGILQEKPTLFNATETREVYDHLLNFAIRQNNSGDKMWVQSYFDINRHLIKTGLLPDGGITANRYKNLTLAALKLGRPDDAVDFLERYKKLLPTPDR